MKPKFALDLTSDSIGLLHRAPKGWLSIGEVRFDAPDLTEALDYLRKTALGLSPTGITTKVVIPNGQILYTEVNAPGPSREEKRRQIMAALEGLTPYNVEDLVFDWSGKGATVKVAVVARETLDEAEAFATQHRLNPVSFVAIPDEGSFVGEPWFGPTSAADSILAAGEAVDRDREPIALLHRDLPKTEPLAESPAEAPPAATADAPAQAAVAGSDDTDDLPGLAEALSAEIHPADINVAAPLAKPEPFVAPQDDRDIEAMLEAEEDLAEPPPATPAEPDEAPFAHVTDTGLFPEPVDDRPAARFGKAAEPVGDEDELPPAPSSAAMLAFASRRAAASAGAQSSQLAPTMAPKPFGKPVEELPPLSAPSASVPSASAPPLTAPLAGAKPLPAGLQRNGVAKSFEGPVTSPSLPGSRKPKGKTTAPSGIPAANPNRPTIPGAKTLTKPGGTFGTKPQRGRPRFLGMILTGLLLLFLALVAAWSSFYMSSSNQTTSGTATVDASTPAIEDEMLADLQDPDADTGPLPEADGTASATAQSEIGDATAAAPADEAPVNLATEDLASAATADELPNELADELATAPADPAADPAAISAADPVSEPAPDTAVTTDVTTVAPLAEGQDEIFLAAMDAPPPALDALALPAPETRADSPPDAPMPPPAFGTVYRFDAQGLLMPTPEGILSPEGVMLIAGKPPLLPPARSEIANAAASAASAIPAPAVADGAPLDAATVSSAVPSTVPSAAPLSPADPAMRGFRPLPRPDGLVPATAPQDDAALDAATAAEFAGRRPLARPALVLAAAAAARPAAAPAEPAADLGAQAASLTAQNDAALAAAAAAEAANPSVVAISRRPAERPRDLSRAIEAAVAAAVREPEPQVEVVASAAPTPDLKPEELDEVNEPDVASASPKIPTKANVAKQATFVNAINLSKTNLIGVYGSQSKRYALIRQSNGNYKKVKVGDRIDGGTVQAITDNEVRYQKGGKLVALKMPKA